MRKFVIKCIFFLLSLLPLLIALEWAVVRIPNSYKFKYDYVKKHGGSIHTLAVGYSQIYDGFNAKEYSEDAFNLANSAQYLLEDYYVLEELLSYMPNLKTVIVPIGYTDVLDKEGEWLFDERSCYYREYMNLWFGGHLPVSYWFECFNPRQAIDKARSYYINHEDMVRCDSLGMQQLDKHKKPIEDNNYYHLWSYTRPESEKYFIRSEAHLMKIINMLKEKNVELVLVSPPHYWGQFQPNKGQLEYLNEYTEQLQKKYNVRYFNMHFDSDFNDEDFHNEAHLSKEGAVKFTRKLHSLINGNVN